MTSTTSTSIIVLSRALDQTGDVLALVHRDDLGKPTPCSEWRVSRLVDHLVADPRLFLQMMRGEQPNWTVEPPAVRESWAGAFRVAADDLIHAWHQGAASDSVDPDWQTAEFAVHTWDLARAIGHPTDELDPEVAQRGLDFMRASLTPDNRGHAFAPATECPDDAPIYDRLAAFAGRSIR